MPSEGRSRRGGARLLALAALAVADPSRARAAELRLDALLRGRAAAIESQPAWIEAGFGKLTDGSAGPDEWASRFEAEAQLGLELVHADSLLIRAHGLARSQRDAARGSQVGLVEGFVRWRPSLSGGTRLRATAGLFFPPTSRENVDTLWSSPYTLTLSALNGWIGEEVRLAGVELAFVREAQRGEWLAGITVFGANDSAGALLSWRGWGMGDRLSSVAEWLPLPPLPTLRPDGAFGAQTPEGTRPVDELDGRPGWLARLRWSRPESALIQAAYLDNRADRGLHRGQYAWRTRMASVGGDVHLGSQVMLVAEAAAGDTGMGVTSGPHVDMDFAAGYALLSWSPGTIRVSGRYDRFRNRDRDQTAEPDEEDGHAATLAVLWSVTSHVRVGLEGLRLWNDRPAAAFAGADGDAGATRFLGELRIRF
jgi:hypothetical protein